MRRPRRPRLPIPALAHRHRPRARTLAALALILVAAAPNHATAQTAIQTGAVEATNTQVFPFLGARFGTPQRLSVSAGIGLNLDPGADPTQPSGELLLALAPGLGAERASVTYVHSTGHLGGGIAAGASVLRTVVHPWQAPPNATYVGADVAWFPFIALGPRLGLLRRVSAPTNSRPWLWTLDFGFGF
ncbi:MAG: hypothetical protein WBQ26_13150 [Gemmatimonadaceae bacterium]|nr:hypothetical protein [Gemmatimonadaceae bacterium]